MLLIFVMSLRFENGHFVMNDLRPGKNLYLFGTGTGLAPFMSIVRDPEAYERLEKIVLVHCVRQVSELAYHDYLTRELPAHEFLGEDVRDKLIYYPTVTREPFRNTGRITALVGSGKLAADIGLPQLNPESGRVMLCGSPAMLEELTGMLDGMGFAASAEQGDAGDYVIERAFVEK